MTIDDSEGDTKGTKKIAVVNPMWTWSRLGSRGHDESTKWSRPPMF